MTYWVATEPGAYRVWDCGRLIEEVTWERGDLVCILPNGIRLVQRITSGSDRTE